MTWDKPNIRRKEKAQGKKRELTMLELNILAKRVMLLTVDH